jgi:hypothetical protein
LFVGVEARNKRSAGAVRSALAPARARHGLGNYADADVHHRQALDHFTDLGDVLG